MSAVLEQVIADLQGEAAVLRRAGHAGQADRYIAIAEQIADSCPEWLHWLSEDEAMTYSGRARDYLRARFTEWEARGMAKTDGRHRSYRRCVLEHRGNALAAREAGRRAVRKAS
jgi:hypothetical protein